MCRVLGVSRSGWYESQKRARPSDREIRNAELLDKIREIHAASRGTYGSPRVHAQLARDGVDVAIRFGSGSYPGMTAIRLFDEHIFPVCSPRLLKEGPGLKRPEDLAKHTLLHVEWTWRGSYDETFDWEMWLLAAGVEGVDHSRGPRFSHASHALQAAMEGQGLALGSQALVGDDLAAGRLVRPFELNLPQSFGYFLTFPREHSDVRKIVAFRDWILSEIERNRAEEETNAGPRGEGDSHGGPR